MNNIICLVIILIVILLIIYLDNRQDNFDLLDLTPLTRCNILSKKKYMLRDIRTNLWLMATNDYGTFVPGNFGIELLLSDKPNEYLPVRLLASPNVYLLANYNGKGIRMVDNPPAIFFKLEMYIYNGKNIIGYLNENNIQLYLFIDNNGDIESVASPSKASPMEMLII